MKMMRENKGVTIYHFGLFFFCMTIDLLQAWSQCHVKVILNNFFFSDEKTNIGT